MARSDDTLELNAALKSNGFSGKSQLSLVRKDGSVATKGKATYQISGGETQTVALVGKYQAIVTGGLKRYVVFTSVDVSSDKIAMSRLTIWIPQ